MAPLGSVITLLLMTLLTSCHATEQIDHASIPVTFTTLVSTQSPNTAFLQMARTVNGTTLSVTSYNSTLATSTPAPGPSNSSDGHRGILPLRLAKTELNNPARFHKIGNGLWGRSAQADDLPTPSTTLDPEPSTLPSEVMQQFRPTQTGDDIEARIHNIGHGLWDRARSNTTLPMMTGSLRRMRMNATVIRKVVTGTTPTPTGPGGAVNPALFHNVAGGLWDRRGAV
ncbi:hypothetical protein K458DRAFT_400477 [Lentithecium fluviatile CBS 122367]|uniref:Uncharacterized protein n=1 Tax=Lentithecium fluviatile CBS 122367 TaxID=1168545 RepID=A0A6G1JH53_9PLEO|nr:hypothetical protein K458DRAFT_400477 [Lentithecium fluviatile CBS 122367]